jgi:hypothetical protein|tara:strand:+ start:14594 stop:14929 length:336 start_codon:yes stop_codon:yes gene_type:complete
MLKIISQVVSEEEKTLTLTVELPQPFTEECWVVRMSPEEVAAALDEAGVKRGKWHNPRTIGNRPPQYTRRSVLVFDLPRKAPRKVQKKVDNSSKQVTLKKTRNRKLNTSGG